MRLKILAWALLPFLGIPALAFLFTLLEPYMGGYWAEVVFIPLTFLGWYLWHRGLDRLVAQIPEEEWT